MMKRPVRPCPSCGNASRVCVIHTQSFTLPKKHPLLAAGKYDVAGCMKCGFVYADTPASQAAYDRYYTEMSKYETGYSGKSGKRHEAQAELIASFCPDRKTRIMDIGCGNGELLYALKKKGFKRLFALDPSRKCVKNAGMRGIKASVGGLFMKRKKDKYGLIILSHVLEHVRDLKRAIGNVVSMMDKDGLLYVEVPDAAGYSQNSIVPFYYFDTEHINHFETVSLVNMGLRRGLYPGKTGRLLIDTGGNALYPAVYAVFKRSGAAGGPNDCTIGLVSEYVRRSKVQNSKLTVINRLLAGKKKLLIWGAGNYTMRLLNDTRLSKCNIAGFVDKDPKKQGMMILGRKVRGPEAAAAAGRDAIIVVCSAVFSGEIVSEIKRLGIKNKLVVLK